jgi:hypothetical protein
VIPDELADGMVLAALSAGDRDGSAARAMSPALAAVLQKRLAEVARSSREERHAAVRVLSEALGALEPSVELSGWPPRMRALLAADLPREMAVSHLGSAPPVRRGFRLSRGLRITLRRLAATDEETRERPELAELDGSERAWRE